MRPSNPLWIATLGLALAALLLQACQTEEGAGPAPHGPPEASASVPELNQEFLSRPDAEVRQGYLNGVAIRYVRVDGVNIFQGDILLTDEQLKAPALGKASSAGMASPFSYWRDRTVGYNIAGTLTNPERVAQAIAEWESITNLRFVVRNSGDRITFRPHASSCQSHFGRIGGQQFIELAIECTAGNVMHEIGHAVGWFHEQSRATRNQDIIVNFANIRVPGFHHDNWHTYGHLGIPGFDHFGLDYGSIMMYSSWDGNNGNGPVMTRLDGTTWESQRFGLSAADVALANFMYPLPWKNFRRPLTAIADLTMNQAGITYALNSSVLPGSNGGYELYQLNGSTWNYKPGAGKRLDLDANSHLWVIDGLGHPWFEMGGNWTKHPLPSGLVATDIAGGGPGQAFVITNRPVPNSDGGFEIRRWNGSAWSAPQPGAGIKIDADYNNNTWVIAGNGEPWQWTGSAYVERKCPGKATEISVGHDGITYIITDIPSGGDFECYKWVGTGWAYANGIGKVVAVENNGDPAIGNTAGDLWRHRL